MNVLVLTPDAVGSTLLQRLITIYMQFYDFDRPVINLHELTNGLEKYYSPEFGREIVSKKRVENWGYYQSLQDIIELLASVDHYKVSRLAQYHIRQRQDSLPQQIPFYQYLDQNFFVIACRRHNVFEHALSMTLNSVTKKLNVYNWAEKRDAFLDIYKKQIDLDLASFKQVLNSYRSYLGWTADHFNVSSHFYYDQHLENLERYILNLPVFQSKTQQITWKEKFGIDLATWNRCHNLTGDLSSVALQYHRAAAVLPDQSVPDSSPHMIGTGGRDMLVSDGYMTDCLPAPHQNYFLMHNDHYQTANGAIDQMIKLDIIPSPPPIKKQTLGEKKLIIRNFQQCLEIYNEWASNNLSVSGVLTSEDIDAMIEKEDGFWKGQSTADASADPVQSVQQLGYQNDDHL